MYYAIVLIVATVLIVYWATYTGPSTSAKISFKSHDKCPVSVFKERMKLCERDDDCLGCGGTECVEVTADDPYSFVTSEGNFANVPKGKWCLVPRETGLTCNSLTGTPALSKDVKTGIEKWRCLCSFPSLVGNASLYGDCSRVTACGDGDLTCPPGADFCTPGKKWTEEPDWDPRRGHCTCPAGEVYIDDGVKKHCVTDSCYPGVTFTTSDGTSRCSCAKPTRVNGQWSSTIVHGNRCVRDPCNPSGYTGPDGVCVCDAGALPTQSVNSITDWTCVSPCEGDNNPCVKRGECYINEGAAQCRNCVYPYYQSDDGMCKSLKRDEGAACTQNIECDSGWCTVDKKTCF